MVEHSADLGKSAAVAVCARRFRSSTAVYSRIYFLVVLLLLYYTEYARRIQCIWSVSQIGLGVMFECGRASRPFQTNSINDRNTATPGLNEICTGPATNHKYEVDISAPRRHTARAPKEGEQQAGHGHGDETDDGRLLLLCANYRYFTAAVRALDVRSTRYMIRYYCCVLMGCCACCVL